MDNRKISDDLRKRILRRDGNQCRYCGSTQEPFQIDHVYPYSKGGETSYDNLVVACISCNQKKHANVGMWPKPIGYFSGTKKSHSPFITMVIWIGVLCLLNGFMLVNEQVKPLGTILVLIGIVITFLSMTFSLMRSRID